MSDLPHRSDSGTRLAPCADCGGTLSLSAASCIHCGCPHPFGVALGLGAGAAKSGPSMQCESCGSYDVKTLQMAYETGASRTSSTSIGAATSGGVALGGASSFSTSSTLFADRIAPPKHGPSDGVLFGTSCLGSIGGAAFGAFIGLIFQIDEAWMAGLLLGLIVPPIAFGWGGYDPEKDPKFIAWKNSRVCLSCGAISSAEKL